MTLRKRNISRTLQDMHFLYFFQHNQQYDTLLPPPPSLSAHKLKAGIAYLQSVLHMHADCTSIWLAQWTNMSVCFPT